MKVFELFCFRKSRPYVFYCFFVVRCSHNASFFPSAFISFSAYRCAFCCTAVRAPIVCRTRWEILHLLFISHQQKENVSDFSSDRSPLRFDKHILLGFFFSSPSHLPRHKITQIPFFALTKCFPLDVEGFLIFFFLFIWRAMSRLKGSATRRTWCLVRFQGRALCLLSHWHETALRSQTQNEM